MRESSCGCAGVGPQFGTYGQGGFHFIAVPGADYCWKNGRTREHTTPLDPEHPEKGTEIITTCLCAVRRVVRMPGKPDRTLREAEPQCVYRHHGFVYARCPAYWGKLGYTVSREEPMVMWKKSKWQQTEDEIVRVG